MKENCLLMKNGKCRGLKATFCIRNKECGFYKDKSKMTKQEIEVYELTYANPAKHLGYSEKQERDMKHNEQRCNYWKINERS